MMSLEVVHEVPADEIRPGDRVRLISEIEIPLEMSRRGSEAAGRQVHIPTDSIGTVRMPPVDEGLVSLYILFKGMEAKGEFWVPRHLLRKISMCH